MDGGDFCEDGPVKQRQIRLLDLSLIVIGHGPAAEELVRRRRLAGGRVCWLCTGRLPELAIGSETSTLSSQVCCWACPREAHRDAAVTLDEAKLVWIPPSWRRWRNHELAWDRTARRRHWGSMNNAWRSAGPEIVYLHQREDYYVVLESATQSPGVRVVDNRTKDASLLWGISGTVVFAGNEFRSLFGVATVADTVEVASKLDVSVLDQDAKSFVLVRPTHVLAWAALCFVQFLTFFLMMGSLEPGLRPGETPWWRASFAALSIAPFGFSATDVMGVALTGTRAGTSEAALTSFLCTLGQCVACVTPVGWIGRRYCTWPLYMAQCLAFLWYASWALPLRVLRSRKITRLRSASYARRIRWRAHLIWLAWVLTGTFGSWLLFYAVALFYIYLSSLSHTAGAVALPILTSTVELCILMGTSQVYSYYIMGSRQRDWSFTTLGDQKEIFQIPICMTHAYAESTRLVSILVSTVKAPGPFWIPAILTGFVVNILLRTMLLLNCLSYLLPSCCHWLICPDTGTIILNEARLCFGYPRFVSLLALALANVLLNGGRSWPLFNLHATLLVPTAALLEFVEDLVVLSGALSFEGWKRRVSSFYSTLPALTPGQVMAFDKDRAQPSGPAIGLSGMRFMTFRTVIVIMAPACFFSYNLLTLLLGAGFVHGVCDSWIDEDYRITDGLLWWSPLRC